MSAPVNQLTMRIPSQILGHPSDLVILTPYPARIPPPWGVLYLLHGRTDDCTAWTRHSSVERQADGFPFMIVMPTGHLSLWRDPPKEPGVGSFFREELIPLIEKTFSVIPRREARAVAGLSMGGYGALWLALRWPELFIAASAHSPAVDEHARYKVFDRPAALDHLFGKPIAEELTLLGMIARADVAMLPRLRVDCGNRDPLLEEARMLHRALDDRGIPHEYAERDGAHDWNYWEKNVFHTLRFVGTAFGSRKQEA